MVDRRMDLLCCVKSVDKKNCNKRSVICESRVFLRVQLAPGSKSRSQAGISENVHGPAALVLSLCLDQFTGKTRVGGLPVTAWWFEPQVVLVASIHLL